MQKFYLLSILIFLSVNSFAGSKIYLIRHAPVQIERPGWCSTQTAHNFRVQYNINSVEVNDAEIVFSKIDNPKAIDTVFCSPQLRAIQTAELLFKEQVNLKINDNLMELDYSVIQVPLIKLPLHVWLGISMIQWMTGNNQDGKPSYKQRKKDLEIYSDELITYAETNGKSIVVAHGMVNRELRKILKKKGWKFENRDGNGNLSVNCMVK